MQPLQVKRKRLEALPVESAPTAPSRLPPSVSPPSRPSFDTPGFKLEFDKSDTNDRYRLIRSLASVECKRLPISAIETIVRQYQEFKHLSLRAFIADCEKDPTLACARHFGQLAKLEQTHIAQSHKKKIIDAAVNYNYQPDFFMLANFFGDFFIGGTSFEGLLAKDASMMFKKTYEIAAMVYGYSNPTLAEMLAELDMWSQKLDNIPNDHPEPHLLNLAKEMRDSLIQKGELLIPGGWKQKAGGHAVLYHIKRNPFSFDIYNSGSGLNEFHSSLFFKDKQKFDPVSHAKKPTWVDLQLSFWLRY